MAHVATLGGIAAMSGRLLAKQLDGVVGVTTPQVRTAKRDQTGIEG